MIQPRHTCMHAYTHMYTQLHTHSYIICYTICIEDRPDIKQLLEVMRIKDIDITTRWRDLGLELVDSNKVLKVIEADHPHNIEACCRVMFEKWLERTPNASWGQLVTALNTVEMITAADAVSKRLMLGT